MISRKNQWLHHNSRFPHYFPYSAVYNYSVLRESSFNLKEIQILYKVYFEAGVIPSINTGQVIFNTFNEKYALFYLIELCRNSSVSSEQLLRKTHRYLKG